MKFQRIFLGHAALTLGALLGSAAQDPQSHSPAVQRATRQYREFYLGADAPASFAMRDNNEPAPDPARARRFADSLSDEGAWSDLDYASTARSGWPPATHITRMLAMAAATGAGTSTSPDRVVVLAALHRAFAYWIAHDFQCANWWYNEIGIPQRVGCTALLLGDQLTPAEYHYTVGLSLARYPIARTGQNKVWLAGNSLMRGLLSGDDTAVRDAANAIWSEVEITTQEGIQPDYSFHQHGAQQQFGNYGMAFAVETARWGGILRDTPWQLPADRLTIFRDYLLQGQNWVSWRGAMDIAACGRQLMPHSPSAKTGNISLVMQQTATFDSSHRGLYKAFVARNSPGAPNDLVGTKYFWRSDYLIDRRPEFSATLKLSSNRVIGAEMVNGENLLGHHLGDGMLCLYRDNREYEDIFPVWDWDKLPGVTCAQTSPPALHDSFVPRDFVGGISDGAVGFSALDYVRDGVHAKKSWFFVGDTIICVGTDIGSDTPANIATTLNQSLLRGPVIVSNSSGKHSLAPGHHILPDAHQIDHDGWRYILLSPGNLHLDAGSVTGNWQRVFDNPETPKADVTKEVFKLWIDHGQAPPGAAYAYSVSLASATEQPQLLENSAHLQAVRLTPDKTALVFWSAGTFKIPHGATITTAEPCLVLVGKTTSLAVDPTHKLSALQLTLNGTPHNLQLPSGPTAGTPASL